VCSRSTSRRRASSSDRRKAISAAWAVSTGPPTTVRYSPTNTQWSVPDDGSLRQFEPVLRARHPWVARPAVRWTQSLGAHHRVRLAVRSTSRDSARLPVEIAHFGSRWPTVPLRGPARRPDRQGTSDGRNGRDTLYARPSPRSRLRAPWRRSVNSERSGSFPPLRAGGAHQERLDRTKASVTWQQAGSWQNGGYKTPFRTPFPTRSGLTARRSGASRCVPFGGQNDFGNSSGPRPYVGLTWAVIPLVGRWIKRAVET
jgi:hypothetical protein